MSGFHFSDIFTAKVETRFTLHTHRDTDMRLNQQIKRKIHSFRYTDTCKHRHLRKWRSSTRTSPQAKRRGLASLGLGTYRARRSRYQSSRQSTPGCGPAAGTCATCPTEPSSGRGPGGGSASWGRGSPRGTRTDPGQRFNIQKGSQSKE